MGISKVEYDNEILMDVSNDTITAEKLAEGLTAHNSNGDQITGTFPIGEVDTQSALISQIKSTLANKVISGGSSSGSGLVDVDNRLPTSGINERAVYRVSYDTNCYIKVGSDVKTLEEYLQMAEVSVVPQYYEVDSLPTEMVESDFDTQVHIYILRDSGIAYVNSSGEIQTLGQWGFGNGFDKGITVDAYSETTMGVYTTIDTERYFIRDDSEWVELVSKNSGGEAVSNVLRVTCDINTETMEAENFSHSAVEIVTAINNGATVQCIARFNQGVDIFFVLNLNTYCVLGDVHMAVFNTMIEMPELYCLSIQVQSDNSGYAETITTATLVSTM